jgi:hypothetical protein
LKVTELVVDVPQLMVGLKIGLTTMLCVVVVAHCPALGVNVYKVVAVLFSAGDQLPVMPLSDVVGNGLSVAPEQMAAMLLNVGVVALLTLIVNVAVVAHCPAFGVNVYNVVAVLFSAGDQLPVMPLSDVVGNRLSVAPEQMAAMLLNVGVVTALIVMDVVAVMPGQPPTPAKL